MPPDRRTRSPGRSFLPLVAIFLSLPLAQGCAFPVRGGDGTTHHVVIGLGIVSVNDSASAVLVTRTQVLGLNVSDRPGLRLGAGYSSGTTISIAPNAEDVRVEVRQRPGGPIIVEAPATHVVTPAREGSHGPSSE